MTEKQQMMSEHAGNWWRRFECCILNTKEVRSSNKFKKHWNARVTDEFSSETLILRKRLSSLYTKCVQFLPSPSLLFRMCYAGDMMIPCQVSTFPEFILKWFSISRSFSSLNNYVNDRKTTNDVRTCWKLMTLLWMLHTERKNSLEFK